MMARLGLLLAALMWTMALPAQADTCNRPTKVKIPDPAKADAKDFEKAHKDLMAYYAAVNSFNDCLKKENADVSAEYLAASQEYDKAVKAYNASAEKPGKN